MGKAKKSKVNKATSKPYSKAVYSKHKLPPSRGPASQPPFIPYEPDQRILLVGEGDYSFSYSLLTVHGCASLVATCYDARSALLEKYPQAGQHVREIEAEKEACVLYNVDVTKLNKAGKEVRKGGFDRIVFNFPHVGGLTKDVNRQVRHNQELLVGFFKSALPLLAPEGCIVITIFEGEPYTLWNVRDLARHVGMKVQRSFKFEASAYPGYKHARTLGNMKDGGGWKGEDRTSRTYIFEAKDRDTVLVSKRDQKKQDTDDDEDD